MGATTDDSTTAAAASFSGRTRIPSKRTGGNPLALLPPEEARVKAIAEVVNGLIQAVQEGRDVDLNALKTEVRACLCDRVPCSFAAAVAAVVASVCLRHFITSTHSSRLHKQQHSRTSNQLHSHLHTRSTPRTITKTKQISRKYGLPRAPKLVEMIAAVPEEHRATLLPQLRAKPVRTASGIAVVAVMSKPHRCPHIATTGACGCGQRWHWLWPSKGAGGWRQQGYRSMLDQLPAVAGLAKLHYSMSSRGSAVPDCVSSFHVPNCSTHANRQHLCLLSWWARLRF